MRLVTYFTLSLLGLVVHATDVTLFQFDPQPTGSSATETEIQEGTVLGVSPIAVDKSSATLYVASEANSLLVYKNQVTTVTLSTPTTATYTFRADASRYHLAIATTVSGASAERTDDCTYNADGGMSCVVKVVAQANGKAVTVASSSSGRQKPWYTVTNVEALALPTTSGASGALGKDGMMGTGALVMSVLLGAWLM